MSVGGRGGKSLAAFYGFKQVISHTKFPGLLYLGISVGKNYIGFSMAFGGRGQWSGTPPQQKRQNMKKSCVDQITFFSGRPWCTRYYFTAATYVLLYRRTRYILNIASATQPFHTRTVGPVLRNVNLASRLKSHILLTGTSQFLTLPFLILLALHMNIFSVSCFLFFLQTFSAFLLSYPSILYSSRESQ